MTPRCTLLSMALLAACSNAVTPMATPPPRDVTDSSVTDSSVTDSSVTDASVTDASVTDAPVTDASVMVRPRNVDAVIAERTPGSFALVQLPMGAQPLFPWVSAEGRGYVVTADGRYFTVDAYGGATELERLGGDPRGARETPPNALVELTPGEPAALTPDGAVVVRDGTFRRAALPPLLSNARALARWGTESLWATGAGLYTTLGPRWLRLDRAGMAVTDATALQAGPMSGTTLEAWVLRADRTLHRLRVTPRGEGADVVWSDPVPGLELGEVRSVASLGAHRYIARALDLLRVDAAGTVERLRVPGMYAGPTNLVTSGPWLWALWTGSNESALVRYDGERAEVLARGLSVMSAQLAVGARGDAALLIDGARVRRLVTTPAPLVTGFADGLIVTEPRLPLQVDPPAPAAVADVTFTLDGSRVERVMTPPFRWGDGGASLYRSFPAIGFGEHEVEVVVTYRGAPEIRIQRRFRYLSPLGRVPTYQGDILPLYRTACARCHSTGIARDLAGYQRLADMAPIVAEVVQSRRMPPDFTLDTPSIQVFSAWVAGGSPDR